MGATAGGGVGATGAMLGAADVVGVAGAMLGAADVVGGADVAVAALGAVAVDGVAAVVGVAGAAAGVDTLTGVGDVGAGPPLQPTTSAAAKSANPIVYIVARIRFAISVLPISDGAPFSRLVAADFVRPSLRIRPGLLCHRPT